MGYNSAFKDGIVYLDNGRENIDGSKRVCVDQDTGYTETQKRIDGIWQPSPVEGSSFWVSPSVGVEGIGHHLITTTADGHIHFHVHSEFDGELTVDDAQVLYGYSYTPRMVLSADDSTEWQGTSLPYEFTPPFAFIAHTAYYKIGSIAPTEPVRFRVWQGTGESKTLIFTQMYPASDFPANTEISVNAIGYVEFDTGQDYTIEADSTATFSMLTNSSFTMPWGAMDVTKTREDNILQTMQWEDGYDYGLDQYLIYDRQIYVCNTAGVQTGTWESNSAYWDMLSHEDASSHGVSDLTGMTQYNVPFGAADGSLTQDTNFTYDGSTLDVNANLKADKIYLQDSGTDYLGWQSGDGTFQFTGGLDIGGTLLCNDINGGSWTGATIDATDYVETPIIRNTDGDTLTVDDHLKVNGNVGIGKASAVYPLEILSNSPVIFLENSRTIMGSGYNVGAVIFNAGESTHQNVAEIRVNATENWIDTSSPTRMEFYTTPVGSEHADRRMIIDETGDVNFEYNIDVVGRATSDNVNTTEISNTLGLLKIQPDVQGDVEMFGDTDVDNSENGKIFKIWRRAPEGNTYLRFYISANQTAYLHGSGNFTLQAQQPFTINSVTASINLKVGDSAGSEKVYFKNSDGDILMDISSSGKLRLDANQGGSWEVVRGSNNNIKTVLDSTYTDLRYGGAKQKNRIGTWINQPFQIVTNSLERIEILADGSVEIGGTVNELTLYGNGDANVYVGGGNVPYLEALSVDNVFVGQSMLTSVNAPSSKNIIIGSKLTMPNVVSCSDNVLVGTYSCKDAISFSNNTIIGNNSLLSENNIDRVVAIGDGIGGSNADLAASILIGYNIDTPETDTDYYLNIGDLIKGNLQSNYPHIRISQSTAKPVMDEIFSVDGDTKLEGYLTVDDYLEVTNTINNINIVGETKSITDNLGLGEGMPEYFMSQVTTSQANIFIGYHNAVNAAGTMGLLSGTGNLIIGDFNGQMMDGNSGVHDRNIIIGGQSGNVRAIGDYCILIGDMCDAIQGMPDYTLNIGQVIYGEVEGDRVRIGGDDGTALETSAALEIDSTTGALLLPRMTTTQRNALTPVNGMMIYNTSLHKAQLRANGSWVNLN